MEKDYKNRKITFIIVLIFIIITFFAISKIECLKDMSNDVVNPDIFEIDNNDDIDFDTDEDSDSAYDSENSEDFISNNTNANISSNNGTFNSVRPNSIYDSSNSNTNSYDSNVNDSNIPTNTPNENNDDVIDGEVHANWQLNNKVNIFQNLYFNNQNIIAPGVSSVYQFAVVNKRESTVKYSIKMLDTNPYNINMKYRLKKGNTYVIGDDNTWVSASDLFTDGNLLDSLKSDVYSLEWKWVDTDYDTEIGGLSNATYSLSIEILAEDV